ncbi:glucans biosynthesis protein MdoC [Mixta calida]|uniref:Glucans biosynthesis protein C n=1 Tax=Mixta calida TaxID=665913 RepID=A0ABN5H8L0_9GAMM|nr:glucans biosynthesis protein MdoC [Mixta calida]MBS6058090.1 glucans biosynthesis protein MdoC [Pantoea sp.]AUY24869.1 glucans biosynthesis protein MdoC [Mixta calida]KAF0861650.1 glucan biosynthesis protein [Mixta calida B021323]MDU5769320.1 glucans biosynthesis protein MdoC [Mixta calida]MDU5826335.1 glucans biosynthesis protein MdoC [Mixta calida]
MRTKTQQREYFFDSIRAYLMLLGVPFHVSLIYSSHQWSVNSAEPSLWLTIFNDFIHAFRMQVFFVISGYFSYMLYLRYAPKEWWKVRVERVGIPMLTAIPLITLPQFFMLKAWTGKVAGWPHFSLYDKYNTLVWELISHLWFLLVLVIFTTLGLWLFRRLRVGVTSEEAAAPGWMTLTLAIVFYSLCWCVMRRLIFIFQPALLTDGLFNFVVMQTLFYLPFFCLGALAWRNPALKARFIRFNPWTALGAALAFIAYMANQRYSSGEGWMYEIDAVVSMLMGLWMVNMVFAFGHRFLNAHSARITWLVNASLFIYLVHHPLTLLYGIFITPHIHNNALGFVAGLAFVFGIAFLLYEIHLRIPLLRFLFSGKKPRP